MGIEDLMRILTGDVGVADALGKYARAQERHNAACAAADDVAAKQEGRDVTDAERAARDDADDAELDALDHLAQTRPQTVEGVRLLAAHAAVSVCRQGWDQETIQQLFATIAESPALGAAHA